LLERKNRTLTQAEMSERGKYGVTDEKDPPTRPQEGSENDSALSENRTGQASAEARQRRIVQEKNVQRKWGRHRPRGLAANTNGGRMMGYRLGGLYAGNIMLIQGFGKFMVFPEGNQSLTVDKQKNPEHRFNKGRGH